MNLVRLDSVGSIFDISDNQVYPQLVDGLPDLRMGVDMYDVDTEWISSLSDEDKGKILKQKAEYYSNQYAKAYKEYLKTLETEELKDWVESKSNYTMNSSDDREILIDDIVYDETLELKYAISDYNLTDKQIKVYKFDELDKQTKEKVIENYRYINVEDTFWYDCIKEEFDELGLEIKEFNLDRGNYAKIYIDNLEETSKNIIEEFGDSVLIKQTAKNYINEYEKIQANFKEDEDIERELEILDEQYEKEYSEDILSYLRSSYDWEISDEAITETIEANDYDFTTDGKIYR